MNPNIELSAHDRFFTAIGAGIMPLSDRNSYITERFPEALPYSFDFSPGSIEAALEKLFSAPETALETAKAMRERTRQTDGVEHAAIAILEVMQSARFLHFTPKSRAEFLRALETKQNTFLNRGLGRWRNTAHDPDSKNLLRSFFLKKRLRASITSLSG